MTHNPLSDAQIQNYLAAITDAVLAGQNSLASLRARSDADSAELDAYTHLITQLDQAFVPVQPSPRFVRRLSQDLMGTDTSNMLVRVRRLPPRVQIAAGIALLAGFVLISRRRPIGVRRADQHEIASA